MHRAGKAERDRRQLRVTRPDTHQKRVQQFAHIARTGLFSLLERHAVEAAHEPVQRILLQPQTQEQPVMHVQLVPHRASAAGRSRRACLSCLAALDHIVDDASDRRKTQSGLPRELVLAENAVLHGPAQQRRVLLPEKSCICHGAPLFFIVFNSVLKTIFSITHCSLFVNRNRKKARRFGYSARFFCYFSFTLSRSPWLRLPRTPRGTS